MTNTKLSKIFIAIICVCVLSIGSYCGISFAEPGIKIVEPLEGAIFVSGENIPVVVESIDGYVFNNVVIITHYTIDDVDTPSAITNLKTPEEAIGSLKISVSGEYSSERFVWDEVTVNVQPNATLQSLHAGILMVGITNSSTIDADYVGLYLREDSSPMRITVEGMYSDGIRRDLRVVGAGTTYVSNDEAIATVSEDGTVTIQGVGETTITVSNSGLSTDVPVNIQKKWVSLAKEGDTVAPTTQINITPSANWAGWHNRDFTVILTATDNEGGSGVQEIHYSLIGSVSKGQTIPGNTANIDISAEGISTLNYYATDNAENSESENSIELKLDKTNPIYVMPNLDSTYIYNSTLAFNFSASDSLSGVSSISAILNGEPIASGDMVQLNNLGGNTFNLEAGDYAGNVTSQSTIFSVQYIFSGFLPPIVADGSKVYKHGRTLPIKFQFQDNNQDYISTAIAALILQQFSDESPIGDPIEVESTSEADTGNMFRYDLDNEQYIFNLNTKGLSPGTWQLQVQLDDGTTKTGFIKLK